MTKLADTVNHRLTLLRQAMPCVAESAVRQHGNALTSTFQPSFCPQTLVQEHFMRNLLATA